MMHIWTDNIRPMEKKQNNKRLSRPFRRSQCLGCSRRTADSRRPAGTAPSTTAGRRGRRWPWSCWASACTRSSRRWSCGRTRPPPLPSTDKEIAQGKHQVVNSSEGQPGVSDLWMTTRPGRPDNTCFVGVERTLAPGERILEGVEKIPQDPGHDGVVVHAHQEGHQQGCDPWNKIETVAFDGKTAWQ